MTAQDLIDTEEQIKALWEAGELPYLIHLAGGNEKELIRIFDEIAPTDWVFASHRCHYHYLLSAYARFKANACDLSHADWLAYARKSLIDKVRIGKSMFLYHPRFVCSAIVAGQCSIAAGMALAIKRRGGSERCWCFVGDGAEDEGHFYESVWFVEDRELPCTFIIEDNNSSCGVTKMQRRGANTARHWPKCVQRYFYTPTWPHAGSHVRPQLKWKAQT